MINTISNEEILLRVGKDLQQRIARIQSCHQSLTQAFGHSISDAQQQWLEMIGKDCVELKSILHSLISVDQQHQECLAIQTDTTLLNTFLSKTVSSYPMGNKPVSFIYEDIDEPIYLYIDQAAMQEALHHIFSNALKFSEEGQVVIKLIRYANVANISISDRGIGIPKKLRPYMFSKFSKATRRGTAGEESTGLGLYFTKKIIERHQGSVWLESEEGSGTTAYINLPIREKIQS